MEGVLKLREVVDREVIKRREIKVVYRFNVIISIEDEFFCFKVEDMDMVLFFELRCK